MKTLLLTTLLSFLSHAALVGSKAPDFKLMNENSKEVSLSDFKGKIVILEWLNHGCPFIKKHYNSGNMQKSQKELIDENTVWLSIISSAKGKQGYVSADEAKKEKLAKKSNATHILLDKSGEVGRAYGAKTTPHMFLIGKDGLVKYEGAIDSIASADEGDVSKATNYIIAATKALKNNSKILVEKSRPYGCSVKY